MILIDEVSNVSPAASSAAVYDGQRRPPCFNADEWALFIDRSLCVDGDRIEGIGYLAVQIAEALDGVAARAAVQASHPAPKSATERLQNVLRLLAEEGVANRRSLDISAFCSGLDAVRASRRLDWRGVSAETGVSESTLSRMRRRGVKLEVDGFLSLCAWAGLDPMQLRPRTRMR